MDQGKSADARADRLGRFEGATPSRSRRRAHLAGPFLMALVLTSAGCQSQAIRPDSRRSLPAVLADPSTIRGQDFPEVDPLAEPYAFPPPQLSPALAPAEEDRGDRDSLFTNPDGPSRPADPKPNRRLIFGLAPIDDLFDDRVDDVSTYFPSAENDPRQPDIRKPGPDTANFPNSPYTIRQGRVYVEVSPLILSGPSNHSPPTYNAEALFRFGITDRTEFRIFTNGLTAFQKYHRQPAAFGFAPLAFDFKTNFFKENEDYHIPALGLETFLQTNTGSAGFNQNAQVGINLLLDYTLPLDFQSEVNVGVASDPDLRHTSIFEVVLQWAIQREIVEGFDLFYHGFLNGSPVPRAGDGIVMGGGAIWAPNRRFAFWGSYNAGVTRDAPTTFFQLGSAVAF